MTSSGHKTGLSLEALTYENKGIEVFALQKRKLGQPVYNEPVPDPAAHFFGGSCPVWTRTGWLLSLRGSAFYTEKRREKRVRSFVFFTKDRSRPVPDSLAQFRVLPRAREILIKIFLPVLML